MNKIKCPYCNEESNYLHLHIRKHRKKLRDIEVDFPDLYDTIKKQLKCLAEIRKQTIIEKYGVENISQLTEIKEKKKKTIVEKYGVENPSQSIEIKEKKKKAYIEKYGVDNPSKSDLVKRKKKETSVKNYGVENPSKSKLVKEKSKKTCIEKYGVEYVTQSDSMKQKSTETLIKKYGVSSPLKSEKIKEKLKNTCLNKYGYTTSLQSHEIREKIKQTNIIKYGVDNPFKSEKIKSIIKDYNDNLFLEKLEKILNYLDLELVDDKYLGATHKHKWKCKKCETEFYQLWNVIQRGYNCPVCYPRTQKGYSKAEKEIKDLLTNFGLEIISNDRVLISPLELDIVIPEKNVAIEYDGLYYHNENIIKDKKYHVNKTEKCNSRGIKLIHIFEDEWIFKKDIVISRIKQILGISDSIRLQARKCKINEIPKNLKNDFLEKFHLQGKDNSIINLGAFYDNELVAVMTFSKGNISKGSKVIKGIWELNRFCTNYKYHIPGIASKLLSFFERNYEWDEIFSYADRRWSVGNLYEKLGFEFDGFTSINYWYSKGVERIHRFSLRKKKTEPKDIPEWVLRKKEGFLRIWDCGNLKFKKKNIKESLNA